VVLWRSFDEHYRFSVAAPAEKIIFAASQFSHVLPAMSDSES
jgi:hypothetical protein